MKDLPRYPDLSETPANEAEIVRLVSKIEGIEYSRKLCTDKYCEQQIAARSADGVAKQHLMAKSDGILDMVMGLDQALDVDRKTLERLLEA
jgi:hypothetical protein